MLCDFEACRATISINSSCLSSFTSKLHFTPVSLHLNSAIVDFLLLLDAVIRCDCCIPVHIVHLFSGSLPLSCLSTPATQLSIAEVSPAATLGKVLMPGLWEILIPITRYSSLIAPGTDNDGNTKKPSCGFKPEQRLNMPAAMNKHAPPIPLPQTSRGGIAQVSWCRTTNLGDGNRYPLTSGGGVEW